MISERIWRAGNKAIEADARLSLDPADWIYLKKTAAWQEVERVAKMLDDQSDIRKAQEKTTAIYEEVARINARTKKLNRDARIISIISLAISIAHLIMVMVSKL